MSGALKWYFLRYAGAPCRLLESKIQDMKKKYILLPILFSVLTPGFMVSAEDADNVDACTESWTFENFGKKAAGQMNVADSVMTIRTSNTKNAFYESDEYSFAYRGQDFPYDDCSRTVIEVTVDRISSGSAGIMIRSDRNQSAANVHLEANATGDLFLFFRKSEGEFTAYRRVAAAVSFPVDIRLTRQGNMYMSHYRNASGEWVKGPTVVAEVGDSQLAGFYACSGNDSQIGYEIESDRRSEAVFSNWTVTYEENYIPAEENFVDMEPVGKNLLLRENFADGSLSNGPESVGNPIWQGIRYAELPYDGDGGRYWRKRGDGIYHLGDKKWADYAVDMDFSVSEDAPKTAEFSVFVRYQHISIYEKMIKYYGVTLRDGNKLVMCRYESNGNTVVPMHTVTLPGYADGKRHKLQIRMMDKDYEVLWDGESVIKGTDELRPVTYGNIAFKFTDMDMSIHRIEVSGIEDSINGSLDNLLLDYYDTPIPSYLEKYGVKLEKK